MENILDGETKELIGDLFDEIGKISKRVKIVEERLNNNFSLEEEGHVLLMEVKGDVNRIQEKVKIKINKNKKPWFKRIFRRGA